MENMKNQSRDFKTSKAIVKEEKSENEIPSEIPKVIRGPTEYKTGQFRNIREGPSYEGEELHKLQMNEENDVKPKVFKGQILESSNAKLYVGNLSDHRKVLLSTRKNDTLSQTNTYNNESLNMVRAKALYAKEHTTYAEHIDEAFCHFFSENDSSSSFMDYLEHASEDIETQELTSVFPFLNTTEDFNKIRELKNERAQVRTNLSRQPLRKVSAETQVLNQQIDQLYQHIYDNQLKKAEFSKRLNQIMESSKGIQNEPEADSEEFWLWVLIRKIRDYIKDEVEELKIDGEQQ